MFSYPQNIACWSEFLNKNTDWVKRLNDAFDAVGFTQTYVDSVSRARHRPSRFKAIKDNVWGMVEIDPLAAWILDSPLLQRLRFVRQLGFSYLTYPAAQHTRLEHTIGVYHVVGRLLESFTKTAAVDKDLSGQQQIVRAVSYPEGGLERTFISLAALLHDTGHALFSHVSEDYFNSEPEKLFVGPFTVMEFVSTFYSYYLLGVHPGTVEIHAHAKKKLAEILSVAIIASSRFHQFLAACPSYPHGNPRDFAAQIGALILGDPIAEDDRALPQVLSGPCDADKIDYMLRDAQACGISLSLDVSRLFFRAGCYDIFDLDKVFVGNRPAELKFGPGKTPKRVFIIDQSGTDAIKEMGSARVSLYLRVYLHQLTLNAESHFKYALELAREDKHAEYDFSRDLLSAWAVPDSVSLTRLARSGTTFEKVGQALMLRHLSKRGACFSIDLFSVQMAVSAESDSLDALSKAAHGMMTAAVQKFSAALKDDLTQRRALCAEIKQECEKTKQALLKNNCPADLLPESDSPDIVRLLPAPEPAGISLPLALIMTPSRQISLQGARQPGHQDAGLIPDRRGYLLVPAEWRELALLVFQRVVFNRSASNDQAVVNLAPSEAFDPKEAVNKKEIESRWVASFRVSYRLILNAEFSAHESRIDWARVERLQFYITDAYYSAPYLLRYSSNDEVEALAKQFEVFQGELGWRVTGGHPKSGEIIRAYVEQFPSGLRQKAIAWLKSIQLLDRHTTAALILNAVSKISGYGGAPIRLVGLSPSSGSTIRNFLKDHITPLQAKGVSLHSSLDDALKDLKHGEKLVLFDDNLASGIQAERQLNLFFGQGGEVPSGSNYFSTALSEADQKGLRASQVGFAFAVCNDQGKESGKARLEAAASRLGLNLGPGDISASRSLSEWSGKAGQAKAISDDLRDFLRQVGTGVIGDQLQMEPGKASTGEIERRALGYDNLEGLCVTASNVPTSTYTALWCPGNYRVTTDRELPWRPLFIRTGKLRDLILF